MSDTINAGETSDGSSFVIENHQRRMSLATAGLAKRARASEVSGNTPVLQRAG